MDHAVARIDWGRWVADCPGETCTNAMLVTEGQTTFSCWWMNERTGQPGGCGTTAPLDWPPDPEAVEAPLAGLPESQQQWRPDEPAGEAP